MIHCNNNNGSRAAPARGFMALCAVMLAMGLAVMARPVAAAPFAYVTNRVSSISESKYNVKVIDTATNKVVATVPVGSAIFSVAVTPDGQHVYVAGESVFVIDTATNKVVATIAVGGNPEGVAVTPDGKHVYVGGNTSVSVIDTATNTLVATVPVGSAIFSVAVTPDGRHVYVAGESVFVIDTSTNKVVATITGVGGGGVAVTPDGKHAYVTSGAFDSKTVWVIDTASNTVVATLRDLVSPFAIAVTPDGQHVYVADFDADDLAVIATATNKVVATVHVNTPTGLAITPDGKHVYVGDFEGGSVYVIATASNTVVATTGLDSFDSIYRDVAIVPPPPGVPFLAFGAKLAIELEPAPNTDIFNLQSNFTLSSTAPAIHPHFEPVTVQVGTFTTTIPPGSFVKQPDGSFTFAGVIDGVILNASITPAGTLRYAFNASATGSSLTGTKNEVYVTLKIGNDSGATSVTAAITHS